MALHCHQGLFHKWQFSATCEPHQSSFVQAISSLLWPGLPFFSEEPQDLEVTAGTLFNLSCGAQGPPEPVLVIWLQDSVPLNSLADLLAETPSVLGVRGESVHAMPGSSAQEWTPFKRQQRPGWGGDCHPGQLRWHLCSTTPSPGLTTRVFLGG
ncbi:Tyrosine-protein kinase receptor UFO, partial [Ophiophagus hannah]